MVSVGSTTAPRQIQHVAAGRVSATSTDAVNGSQLYATDQAINNLSNVVTATATHYYSVNDGGTQQANYNNNGATGADSLAAGVGAYAPAAFAVALGPFAAATGSAGIAVGQKSSAVSNNDIAIGTNAYAGASISTFSGADSASTAIGENATATGGYSVAQGYGADAVAQDSIAIGSTSTASGIGAIAIGTGASANNKNDVALGAGSGTAAANPTNSATIATASGGQLTLSGFAGANPASVVSVGAPGAERQITNVAAGRVTATSTDAVNGSELYAVASAIDTAVNGGGIKYFHANSNAADSSATGTDSIAVGPSASAYGDSSIAQGSGALAGVNGNTAVSGDVALGSGAQATGGRSLALGNGASVATLGGVALGAGSVASREAGTYVDPITGGSFTTALGAVSVGASGTLRQITNVAPGTQLTDAVNLGQLESALSTLNTTISSLPSTNPGSGRTWITGNPGTYTAPVASGENATAGGSDSVASASGSTAIGDHANASGANSVALGANSVATAPNTVSIGSTGNERTLSNVAAGVNGTDAVNVNQLNAGVSSAVSQSNQYTDQQVSSLRRDMNSGAAAAMAVAGLPQPAGPGKSVLAVAGSTWQGQQGLAFGVSTVSENGRWIYKGSLTTSSRGGTGAVIGAGYQW
ncbi:hemagglutinin [Trinickia violacea]|uniref:Hemagglutinin n=1 Tax=Trinickia violacea TaxID=2571746 RepID=A0A4P8J7B0_9BURK|nr:hemagglutinin [Trinickia violacea]